MWTEAKLVRFLGGYMENTTTYFTSANVVRVITETDVERKIKELEEKYCGRKDE